MEGPDLPDRTAREVTIEEMRSTKLEKNQMNIYYLYLDAMHKEIFRRLANKDYPTKAEGYQEAKKFQDRCKKRGVPLELLDPEKCRVMATRAIGYGSSTMRDTVTREVMALSPGFDEIGRNNAMRDRLAALVGYTMTDRYIGMTKRDQIPTDVHSIATLENNDILNGQQVLVGVDQPHAIHWLVHYPLLAQIAQAFMKSPQTMNIQTSVTAMGIGLQHLAGHLSGLQRDPARKGQVKQLTEQFEQLMEIFKQMQKAAAKIQEAQAKQQQQQAQQIAAIQQGEKDKELRLKFEEMMRDHELKKMKAEANASIANAKAQAGIAREDAKARAEINREDAKAAASVGM
jgi:hypothetical protein